MATQTGPGSSPGSYLRSFWERDLEKLRTAPLEADLNCDVCVVGAGIAGMMVAYKLACLGRRVVVLDDEPVGGGMTSRTTAHLVNALDDRYYDLQRFHGQRGAQLAAQSHSAAIDQLELIASLRRLAAQLTASPCCGHSSSGPSPCSCSAKVSGAGGSQPARRLGGAPSPTNVVLGLHRRAFSHRRQVGNRGAGRALTRRWAIARSGQGFSPRRSE